MSFGNVFKNLDWSVMTGILISIVPALFCITIHELAHGFTAYCLGDSTAKDMGRLTLNPIRHIDVFGILMMVVAGFGWAKPVPVNMYRFKKPKWYMAITALAGPVSNIILAAIIFFIYGLIVLPLGGARATDAGQIALQIVYRAATLSIALAVFNLIPIPPLDGAKVLFALLPSQTYYSLMKYEKFGMILLIIFVWSDIFSSTVGRVTYIVRDWFSGIAQFAYNMVR